MSIVLFSITIILIIAGLGAVAIFIVLATNRLNKAVDKTVVGVWQDAQNRHITFSFNKNGTGVYTDTNANQAVPFKVTAKNGFMQIFYQSGFGNKIFNYVTEGNFINLYQNGMHITTLQRIS